jgi:hypothetical protein
VAIQLASRGREARRRYLPTATAPPPARASAAVGTDSTDIGHDQTAAALLLAIESRPAARGLGCSNREQGEARGGGVRGGGHGALAEHGLSTDRPPAVSACGLTASALPRPTGMWAAPPSGEAQEVVLAGGRVHTGRARPVPIPGAREFLLTKRPRSSVSTPAGLRAAPYQHRATQIKALCLRGRGPGSGKGQGGGGRRRSYAAFEGRELRRRRRSSSCGSSSSSRSRCRLASHAHHRASLAYTQTRSGGERRSTMIETSTTSALSTPQGGQCPAVPNSQPFKHGN